MNEFMPESKYEEKFIYNVWIKDAFNIEDYHLAIALSMHGQNPRRKDIVRKIYKYHRSRGFNILYAYIHMDSCYSRPNALSADEVDAIWNIHHINYARQVESLKYMHRIFPNHKIIRLDYTLNFRLDDYSYNCRCLCNAINIMEKGDIFHCFNPGNQNVQTCDIILMDRKLENIPTSNDEKVNIMMNNTRCLTLDQVRMHTKDYITITDEKFYSKKITLDTLVLATSERLGENSSLKVLPPHLLREIGRWF